LLFLKQTFLLARNLLYLVNLQVKKIMAKKVSVLSQKGGVGKSTIIRLIAREFAFAGWNVKIGDFDINQGTCVNWKRRREQDAILPEVAVETFRTVSQALKVEKLYDLFLFDGQPHSSSLTLEIARVSLFQCNMSLKVDRISNAR
jgi:chromosome partitioning protein